VIWLSYCRSRTQAGLVGTRLFQTCWCVESRTEAQKPDDKACQTEDLIEDAVETRLSWRSLQCAFTTMDAHGEVLYNAGQKLCGRTILSPPCGCHWLHSQNCACGAHDITFIWLPYSSP
jgi:hypothetical protein